MYDTQSRVNRKGNLKNLVFRSRPIYWVNVIVELAVLTNT